MSKKTDKRQFAVIGLGRFGKSVALTLTAMGHDVLALDNSETEVQTVSHQVTHAVQVDARDEEALKSLGIRNFDVVIVAIGEDIQSNILVAIMLKDLGVRYVVAKAQNSLHGRVLEKVGVDRIVYPEKDMGIRIAHSLVTTNSLDLIELSSEFSIVEVISPGAFHNKTLGELNLRVKYKVSVIAIKHNEVIVAAPGANSMIVPGDILIIIGGNDAIKKLPR